MILIIDNYDSFTYNLYQQVAGMGHQTQVYLNDKVSTGDLLELKPEKIIISPGWGTPQNSGACLEIIQNFYTKLPILGICMGLQCMGICFGASIQPAKQLLYGERDYIKHSGGLLFNGINKHFRAARYNSLVIDNTPTGFTTTATDKFGDIMAFEHDDYPLFGVQFHPESFLTRAGDQIISNFLNA